MPPTDEEITRKWANEIVAFNEELDDQNDKGGHDWHSMWTGFVIALGRRDLTSWSDYMRLGFPAES